MPFVEWDPNLALGHPDIDRQHQGLFEAFNRLHEATSSGKRDECSLNCLGEITRYVQEHFRDEEALMFQAGYPDLPSHKEKHRLFEEKTTNYTTSCELGYAPYTDMLEFLRDWLKTHIGSSDLAFIRYARAKGVVA